MTGRSLDEIGLALGAPQASSGADYLSAYEHALDDAGVDPALIVLALRTEVLATARAFAERYPSALVHLLAVDPAAVSTTPSLPDNVVVHRGKRPSERAAALAMLPRPDLLVEGFARTAAAKTSAIRQLHGWVRAGGVFAVESIDITTAGDGKSARRLLEDADARRVGQVPSRRRSTWIDALAASTSAVTFHHDLAVLTKSEMLPAVLRTAEALPLLQSRYGAERMDQLAMRPARTFVSRAEVTTYGNGPAVVSREIPVPPRALRRYRDVVTYPRQIVRMGDYWLPDTYRRQTAESLQHRGLLRSGEHLALHRPSWRPDHERACDGPVFYLDTEFPGHFGHITTEVLSRLWAWDRAREAHPDLRPLVSLRPTQTEPSPALLAILDAYGIDAGALVIQRGDEALRCATLLGADPQMENPRSIDPEIADTWARIKAGLGAVRPPVVSPRIFVTRTGRRVPRQSRAIEAWFSRQGFAIVNPADYAYAEQVALFAQARVIAGYAGSAMFTAAYAPQARVIVLSGDAYTPQNEALIAAAAGHDLHYFWGRTLRTRRPRKGRQVLFELDFSFNLRRWSRTLRKLVR